MKYDHSECYAEIGSVTQAMKAQAALNAAAIPSEVIKTGSNTKRGCVYAVEFSCQQANNVSTVLSKEKINVRYWNVD